MYLFTRAGAYLRVVNLTEVSLPLVTQLPLLRQLMDPIQSRSITIQTRMSAVKTLSISCQVFARSLGCNEVLINNSWLSLIFNGSRLHDTLLDEEKRKRQI